MYDVVVIGAGPAGLLVAEQLEREGSEVLVLEAGPREFDTGPEVVSDPAWAYRPIGARCWWPRALAVGGRTNVWGGWLARFGAEVFEDGHWPYGARELAPYYAAAEAWLGATDEPLDPRVRRAARALGLRARGRRCARDPAGGPWRGAAAALAPRVRVNSVALRIDAGPDGAAVQVLRAGCCETLHARAVILAASPIETTRLLLASGVRHAWLGRRLTDHSNLSYILLEPARSCSNEGGSPMPRAAFVPRVVNRRGTPQRRYRGGFSLEIVGPVPVNRLDPEVRALFPALPPDSSYTFVNALGEQRRHTQRFIDLAPRARDALGRRLPRIHLAWSAGERRMIDEMKATCRSLARELASPGAELLPFRDPLILPPIFHPAGTCAMGRDARAPCDPWGRLRAAPRVWIADASVFPSGGDCHPTLTVLAHALRVAASVRRALASLSPRSAESRAARARKRGRAPDTRAPGSP